MNLYPTGECFTDIAELIKGMILSLEITSEDLRSRAKWPKITHGICQFDDGRLYSHCWLEFENKKVLSVMKNQDGKKLIVEFISSEFYKLTKTKVALRYSVMQAYDMEMKYGYPGPWDESIRSLCNDYKDMGSGTEPPA